MTESIERHREMVVSPLKDYLKLKDREVNKPWDKPTRPGHRVSYIKCLVDIMIHYISMLFVIIGR